MNLRNLINSPVADITRKIELQSANSKKFQVLIYDSIRTESFIIVNKDRMFNIKLRILSIE